MVFANQIDRLTNNEKSRKFAIILKRPTKKNAVSPTDTLGKTFVRKIVTQLIEDNLRGINLNLMHENLFGCF